jgi:hypothetical protein
MVGSVRRNIYCKRVLQVWLNYLTVTSYSRAIVPLMVDTMTRTPIV